MSRYKSQFAGIANSAVCGRAWLRDDADADAPAVQAAAAAAMAVEETTAASMVVTAADPVAISRRRLRRKAETAFRYLASRRPRRRLPSLPSGFLSSRILPTAYPRANGLVYNYV